MTHHATGRARAAGSQFRRSAVFVFGVTACGDPLVARQLIADDRVLAARVESESAPDRASVTPGQVADVRWLTAGPDGPPMLGWAFSLCVAKPVSRGLPVCASDDFDHVESLQPSKDEPRFSFSVPTDTVLDGATQVTANGAFCSSGTPTFPEEFEAGRVSCPNSDETPLLATATIDIARGETTNTNPDLARILIQFDDEEWAPWSEPNAAPSACDSLNPAVPKVSANGSPHDINLFIPTEIAEQLPALGRHSPDREQLQLSHFVTDGHLERAFSRVDLTTSPSKVSLRWSAPQNVDAVGRLARFYFVLRDGRGGADWTLRTLCVTP